MRTVPATLILLAACSLELPSVIVSADELHPRVVEWANGAKDMVWSHTTHGAPPDLPLDRVELCDDFAIVFFDASQHRPRVPDGEGGHVDDDLLWAAGTLSEPPEGADGGWVSDPRDRTIQPYRDANVPCETVILR